MPPLRRPPRKGWRLERPRGAAIIVALLAVAVVSALAATMLARLDTRIELASDRDDFVQARQLALSALDLARQMLEADTRNSRIDWLGEPWAQLQQPALHADGRIQLMITDASADAALNGMIGQAAGGDGGGGTQAARYPSVPVPTPLRVPVNINTAPAIILPAILPGATPAQARAIAEQLRTEPAPTLRALAERLPEGVELPTPEQVGVTSDTFLAEAVVQYRVATVTLQALLVRESDSVRVLALRQH